MSSTAMWLLLAVVVIVILFASALYKRSFTPHELALTGVMAALSFAAYLFFRVPFYGGSSFHLGNTFTAWLWPTFWPVTRAMPSPPLC